MVKMDKDDIYFIVGLALAVLAFFGIDWKWVRGSFPPMTLTWRNWLLVTALTGSLVLSAIGWHRKLTIHERIIEKPVEKIVEKIVERDVPIPCPKLIPPKTAKKATDNKADLKIDCGGGNCAQSQGQQGGITAGAIITTEDVLPNIAVQQEVPGTDSHDPSDYGTHPGIALRITLDRKFFDPTFVAKCDRPCTGRSVDLDYKGMFSPGQGNLNPETPWLHFAIPSVMPSSITVHWTIKSNDNLPIKVLSVIPYRIR